MTKNGRTCQAWALDTPHAHSFNHLPFNYCRNPDGESAPWCYTTDPEMRWEKCTQIPRCESGASRRQLASNTPATSPASSAPVITNAWNVCTTTAASETFRNRLARFSFRANSKEPMAPPNTAMANVASIQTGGASRSLCSSYGGGRPVGAQDPTGGASRSLCSNYGGGRPVGAVTGGAALCPPRLGLV